MKLKRQIRLFYLLEIFGTFSLTDGVWVLFLLQRGFSLMEVGIAETVFHIASFLFEIPSGAIADLFGRKKTIAASYICMTLSAFLTLIAWNLPSLCLAMVLTTLGYNLDSGTRDALTYDSLKACGQEERYLSVNSNQRFLCSVAVSLSKLTAGIAGRIGYVFSYLCNMAFSGTSVLIAWNMQEPAVTEAQKNRPRFSLSALGRGILEQIAVSARFLWQHREIAAKMALDALCGCGATLTIFFLQQHFSANGVPFGWIGVFLLAVEAGGMAGTKCAPWLAARLPFGRLAKGCVVLSFLALLLTGSALSALSVSGGFLLRFSTLVLETATSGEVNRDLPSDQRATLISVGSLLFSVCMIAATPALSFLCEALGTGPAFRLEGTVLAVAAAAILLLGRKAFRMAKPRKGR